MKRYLFTILTLSILLMAGPTLAQEKATPQEVFDMVLKAADVLKTLGDEALPAFNDPKGEFVWKDSYVFVINCEKGLIVAHPSPKVRGISSDVLKCQKTGRLILKEGCKMMDPAGFWLEYWFPQLGSDQPVRKIVFCIPVENTPFQVGAAVADEKIELQELNKLIGK